MIYSAIYPECHPFDSFFPDKELVVVNRPEEIDKSGSFLIVWGGGDIHPSFYGRTNQSSYVGKYPSKRDETEWALMQAAVFHGIPIMGVCRGAQMGCALAGGLIVQDVTGHAHDHYIKTIDGQRLRASSLHHQMMFPWLVEHELIAWSDPALSKHYLGLTEAEVYTQMEAEPEIVWFPTIKCLAVQGHPEFMDKDCEFNQYLKALWNSKLTICTQ